MKPTQSVLEAIERARREGRIISDTGCQPLTPHDSTAPANDDEDKKPLLLASCHMPPSTWLIGVETRSETNQRDWKKRSSRTKAAREAVSKCFGWSLNSLAVFADHYHAGGSLRIVFTRLAPKRLDRGNVSAALKSVEDAVALFIGADDGDSRWLASYEQEQSDRYGVRIEMEKAQV